MNGMDLVAIEPERWVTHLLHAALPELLDFGIMPVDHGNEFARGGATV